MEGWVFDLYTKWPDKMIIWLKTNTGIKKLVDNWQPSFYVAGSRRDLDELASRLGVLVPHRMEDWYERVDSPSKSRVLRVFYSGKRDCDHLKRLIWSLGREGSRYRMYNLDVPPDQLYFYEKDLFPIAYVEASESNGRIIWKLLDSAYDIDYPEPSLCTVSLDVSTTDKTSALLRFNVPVGQIRVDNGLESFTIDSGSEEDKLRELTDYFQALDPDVVVTAQGDNLQLPYLGWRAKANNLSPGFFLGREPTQKLPEKQEGQSYFSYGRIFYRSAPIRLLGRFHLDRENAYVYDDCGLDGLIELSRCCRIPLHRASRSTIGTGMTSLQMYTAYKDGFLIPWQKDTPEDFKTVRELLIGDRGGFIYEPQVGLHEKVGELDYSGLYPMIMMADNISQETIRCSCCPDSLKRVPELNWNICNKRMGIVPKSLQILLTKRQAYKHLRKNEQSSQQRDVYKRRSDALKWILVCSFGYLGFKNARFGKIDAHIAVCAFSREVLTRTAMFVRDRGYELLHGIVDSTWLKNDHASPADYERLAREFGDHVQLPLSFEGIYRWIVFLPSKVYPNRPVLNRYYGIFSDGRAKIRGIALRRHDSPGIVRKLQTGILAVLGEAKGTEDFHALLPQTISVLHEQVERVRSGCVPTEDLEIVRNLSKDPQQYSHRVPQAIAAGQLRKNGFDVSAGQTVGYVILDSTNEQKKTAAPAKCLDENCEYDVQSYVSFLVDGFAEILSPLGFGKRETSALVTQA